MLPDTILGVPFHPLVVHAVVVLIPLSVLGTVLITLVPRWRSTYGWLVVALSALGFAAVPIATRSGRRFEASLGLGGQAAEKVNEHEVMGDRVIWAAGALLALNLLTVLAQRAGRPAAQTTTLAVLATVAGLAAGALVVITGHLGATAVWNPAG